MDAPASHPATTQPLIYNVQLLRLLTASAVVFSDASDRIAGWPSPIQAVPWTAGVDVFFVVSGFVMACVAGERFGVRDVSGWFLSRRLIRIVPSYWFCRRAGGKMTALCQYCARST